MNEIENIPPQPEKLNMLDYGYLLEEYSYELKDGKVKEIAYSLLDENGEEIKCVGVSDDEGHYHRSIVVWPKVDGEMTCKGYLNGTVLEMKLDLDSIDPTFKMEDIELITYDGRPDKEHEGDIRIKIKSTDEKNDMILIADKNSRIAHYKKQNLYKSYHPGSNFAYNEIRAYNNCIVWDYISEQDIGAIYWANGGAKQVYEFSEPNGLVKNECPIDVINQTCYTNLECECDGYKYRLTYVYDYDGTVCDVTCNKINSDTGLPEEKEPNRVCRIETSGTGGTGEEEYRRTRYAGVYPTGLTLNHENFDHFRPGELWSLDTADYDEKGNMIAYMRSVYAIKDNDKKEKLLQYITSNESFPILV